MWLGLDSVGFVLVWIFFWVACVLLYCLVPVAWLCLVCFVLRLLVLCCLWYLIDGLFGGYCCYLLLVWFIDVCLMLLVNSVVIVYFICVCNY